MNFQQSEEPQSSPGTLNTGREDSFVDKWLVKSIPFQFMQDL